MKNDSPDRVAIEDGIVVGTGGGRELKAGVFLPPASVANGAGVLLIHGGAWRGVLRCEGLAGPSRGRPAAPADAERIVEILNGCHRGEKMYLPYTVESSTARRARAGTVFLGQRMDDFFAFARLMEEPVNLVAVDHAKIAALHCVAPHPVVIGGKEYQALLLHHSRIPREHQKRGLFSSLNVRGFNTFEGRQNAPYGYVAVDAVYF